jgi:hypothetical protein
LSVCPLLVDCCPRHNFVSQNYWCVLSMIHSWIRISGFVHLCLKISVFDDPLRNLTFWSWSYRISLFSEILILISLFSGFMIIIYNYKIIVSSRQKTMTEFLSLLSDLCHWWIFRSTKIKTR